MEFNQATEDVNFKLEHSGYSTTDVLHNHNIVLFKLLKNQNGFFTSLKTIEREEAIVENQNILAAHKDFVYNNNPRTILSRLIKIPSEKIFHLILLPTGRVIDSRRIKPKSNEVVKIYLYGTRIDVCFQNVKENKNTKIIRVNLWN